MHASLQLVSAPYTYIGSLNSGHLNSYSTVMLVSYWLDFDGTVVILFAEKVLLPKWPLHVIYHFSCCLWSAEPVLYSTNIVG